MATYTKVVKFFAVVTLLITLATSQTVDLQLGGQSISDTTFPNFQKFLNLYQKNYPTFTELGLRFNAFQQTGDKIKTLMKNIKNGTFTLGLNKFSDLTDQEFNTRYCNLHTNLTNLVEAQTPGPNSFIKSADYVPGIKEINSTLNQILNNPNYTSNLSGSISDLVNKMANTNSNSAIQNLLNNDVNTVPVTNNSTTSDQVNLKASTSSYCTISSTTIPSSFDWRNCGAVTAVKNQGDCGCCWAFSTAATIEGQYAIKYGYLVQLAEQQLLNCNTGNSGCGGGFMTTALTGMTNAKFGLPAQYYVPYLGYSTSCITTASKIGNTVNVVGYTMAGSTDEEVIKQFLYKTGPLAVAMNSNSYLQNYQSGILDLTSAQCSPSIINHAVTMVGYGTENGVNYWIIKNSWGTTWGESGYFRIRRGTGACGINQYAIAATLR